MGPEETSLVADMFEQLGSDNDIGDDVVEVLVSTTPAPVTVAPAAVVPPPAAPPPVQPAAAAPTEPPAAPAPSVVATPEVTPPPVVPAQNAPVQSQPGAATPQPTVAPGQELNALRGEITKNREKVIEVLQKAYEDTFTDDDMVEFASEPKKALSKMGARLHVDLVQNMLGTIANQLPQMVIGMMEAQKQHATAEGVFWDKWPQLDREKDKPAVMQIFQVFRQMNPTATAEQAIQMVGAQAMVALNRLQAAPVAQAAVPAARQAPFQPAGNGAAPPPGGAPQNLSPWERMSMVMDADDKGSFEGT